MCDGGDGGESGEAVTKGGEEELTLTEGGRTEQGLKDEGLPSAALRGINTRLRCIPCVQFSTDACVGEW